MEDQLYPKAQAVPYGYSTTCLWNRLTQDTYHQRVIPTVWECFGFLPPSVVVVKVLAGAVTGTYGSVNELGVLVVIVTA